MSEPIDNAHEIRTAAKALLRRAGVGERLPTPVDDLVAAAGLFESPDYEFSESKIAQAPVELQRLLRSAGRKIRGALDRRERVIHVDPNLDAPARREFVRCHETMHFILPWQQKLMVLGDTEFTLAPRVGLRFEQEANHGAAELLFQTDLLTRIARDFPTDITTPVALAQMFGASIHATFRNWIEHHRGAVCGLVLDPKPVVRSPLTYQRFELVESHGWGMEFGRDRFSRRLSVEAQPFLERLIDPWSDMIDTRWSLSRLDGEPAAVRVQSFSNSYRVFLLVWPPRRETFIARHRGAGRIAVS